MKTCALHEQNIQVNIYLKLYIDVVRNCC